MGISRFLLGKRPVFFLVGFQNRYRSISIKRSVPQENCLFRQFFHGAEEEKKGEKKEKKKEKKREKKRKKKEKKREKREKKEEKRKRKRRKK